MPRASRLMTIGYVLALRTECLLLETEELSPTHGIGKWNWTLSIFSRVSGNSKEPAPENDAGVLKLDLQRFWMGLVERQNRLISFIQSWIIYPPCSSVSRLDRTPYFTSTIQGPFSNIKGARPFQACVSLQNRVCTCSWSAQLSAQKTQYIFKIATWHQNKLIYFEKGLHFILIAPFPGSCPSIV